MAKISSLTDNTNDIVYPQTKANAVIMEDSSTVENAVNQRPKLILSASEPTGVVPENTLYGVFGDVGQITTGEIADSAVTTAKIASSAVTDTKLATSAVTTDKIASTAVTTAKIANGAVTGVTNTATSIGTAKLALNTVGTPNLRNGSVTSDKIDWTTLGGRVALGDVATGTSISAGGFIHPNFSIRRVFNSTYASTSSNGGITLQPGHYMVCYGGRISDGSGGNRWFAGLWDTTTASNSDQSGFWFYSNLRYAWTGVIYINISVATTFKPSFYSQDVAGTINQTAWFMFYRSGDTIS